ncbi:N-acetylmuramoyl-L-alanine amidase [Flavobacterium longum]|uniref:N-acetylmuramoyl-L-alanine amidase n=1 Tax=Flavobacterium longum TaxID=1299340 RepID=UPI0039E7C21A
MGLPNKIKAIFLLVFCTVSFTSYSQNSKFKVALDAGHGGKDFGAVYHGHIEKNIALGVTLKVGKILENTPGFEVLYTRKTDVFIELIERANIANRADANIFVSIHCNANKNSAASGTETYVMGMTKNASNLEAARRENSVITLENDYKQKYEGYDPNHPESKILIDITTETYLENSIELAGKVQDQFTDKLGKKSRGVKQAPYMVLHKAYMPRILIEMGFISNPDDGAFLDSEEGQQQIAKAIADAVISYKKEYWGGGQPDEDGLKPSDRVPKQAPIPKPDPDTVVTKPIAKTPPVTTPVKTPVKQPEVKPEPEAPAGNVVFKVQLAVSSNKLELTPANFNGLGAISVIMSGNMYKYMYGQTGDYNEAKRLQGEAKSKGYSSAFLVAFRDGKKITIDEALKR